MQFYGEWLKSYIHKTWCNFFWTTVYSDITDNNCDSIITTPLTTIT